MLFLVRTIPNILVKNFTFETSQNFFKAKFLAPLQPPVADFVCNFQLDFIEIGKKDFGNKKYLMRKRPLRTSRENKKQNQKSNLTLY